MYKLKVLSFFSIILLMSSCCRLPFKLPLFDCIKLDYELPYSIRLNSKNTKLLNYQSNVKVFEGEFTKDLVLHLSLEYEKAYKLVIEQSSLHYANDSLKVYPDSFDRKRKENRKGYVVEDCFFYFNKVKEKNYKELFLDNSYFIENDDSIPLSLTLFYNGQ